MINILYEDNHVIVVEKKPNIPVCEDESKDLDLLNITCNDIKELPLKYCLLQSLLTDDFHS